MVTPIGASDKVLVASIRHRLIPLLCVAYFFAVLNRFNVGFAALQMNDALGLTPAVFGFGAGIFFLGYLVFEVPSNAILSRVGAPVWLGVTMVAWGLVSAATAFVGDAHSFYAVRLFLGIAQGGLFPGMVFYLSLWLRINDRAPAIASVYIASYIAGVLGGPIAGSLLTLNGIAGLAGWQWLFLVEGIAVVPVGLLIWWRLPAHPNRAKWLDRVEHAAYMEFDSVTSQERQQVVLDALRNPRVWALGLGSFMMAVGVYGLKFWLPQLLKAASDSSDLQVSILSAFPSVVSAAAALLVANNSQRMDERRWHVAIPGFTMALGLAVLGMAEAPLLILLGASAARVGGYAGPLYALVGDCARRRTLASSVALVSACTSMAGFVSPLLYGYARASQNGMTAMSMAGAVVCVCGCLMILGASRHSLRLPEKVVALLH